MSTTLLQPLKDSPLIPMKKIFASNIWRIIKVLSLAAAMIIPPFLNVWFLISSAIIFILWMRYEMKHPYIDDDYIEWKEDWERLRKKRNQHEDEDDDDINGRWDNYKWGA